MSMLVKGALQSDVTAIRAKTDNLPSDPADESVVELAILAAHVTTNGKIDAVQSDATDIKAKTDNLPSGPAEESSVKALQGAIYYDSREGETGTSWPIGTPAHPVKTHDDLFTIMAANPTIRKVVVSGVLTLVSGDIIDQHVVFEGGTYFFSTINIPAGVTINTVIFRNLYVDATSADGISTGSFEYCTVGWGAIGASALKNCSIEEPVPGANATWIDITSDDWDLDLTNVTGVFSIYGFNGKVQITNLGSGTVNIYSRDGADITIANSCTSGTINIYGSANVTNNGGGVTVNDFTLETTKT